jgi:hypothetical protein
MGDNEVNPADGAPSTPERRRRSLPRGSSLAAVASLLTVAVLTLVQVVQLSSDFIGPRMLRYWDLRKATAWQRSALLAEGQDFLEYVAFLRETIPAEAKVVLPPHSAISDWGAYTSVEFMQYFMFPRTVLNCSDPVDACVQRLTGPTSYILGLGKFPPPEVASEIKDYLPFDDTKGLWQPRRGEN